MAENKNLDTAVYSWFMQIRAQAQAVNGPLICEKALEMNRKLGGNNDFKASTGCLKRFKSRHGIGGLDIQGKKLSADIEAAKKFKENFKSLLVKQCYKDSSVYNADETGLYWKRMLTKSLVSKKESAAPGFKDAVYMAEAWANVKATTLKKSWNKLCPAVESEASPTSEEPTNENFVSEMVELIKEVLGFEECDQENVHEWLEFDEDDPGYELFTDDDIIAQV
ncbi:jerky protein homolog-like [Anastrepha obliqua]|uniref:jerky protein homolog-like n=1 Tax=Anastrepha obliqua TaxID=95512 RepID=UPI0024099E80|nr:jerky protein homolog-like [Anastrepha obliqua]